MSSVLIHYRAFSFAFILEHPVFALYISSNKLCVLSIIKNNDSALAADAETRRDQTVSKGLLLLLRLEVKMRRAPANRETRERDLLRGGADDIETTLQRFMMLTCCFHE